MKVSVIIPTLHEAASLTKLFKKLKNTGELYDAEFIICDASSDEETQTVAQNYGVEVVRSEKKNRAYQMNLGASHASGDVYYFLHADTLPPKGFLDEITNSISDGYDFGCYRLAFDEKHPLLKFYAWFTRFDFDFFRFGDQSLFVKKTLFNKAGRFDESHTVMEDQEIYSRLRNYGTFKLLKKSVCTSARKYKQVGLMKLQLLFSTIFILYYLGVDKETLMHFYQKTISKK